MISIRCEVFEFTSEDHVIILGAKNGSVFDSGTHKSHLIAALRAYLENDRLQSNKNIILVQSLLDFKNRTATANDCFIVDEMNMKPSELRTALKTVREANAYLIAIGRMQVKQLECSVDAIYALDYQAGYFKVERKFENQPQIKDQICRVVCEDSVAIASLYAEVLAFDDVRPACGRTNFFMYCRDSKNALLIADKPKFGQDLLRLLYELKVNQCPVEKLFLFLPECFEEILCEAAGIFHLQADFNKADYFDMESYYEALAKNISGWNKRKVAGSLGKLRQQFDFTKTEIIQDLLRFFTGEKVGKETRCYEIELQQFHFSLLDDVTEIN